MSVTPLGDPAPAQAPREMSADEWAARVELAACYRIFDHLGWTELIFNHITLRVPGPEPLFLINPFGLLYREVTASNLLKVDLDGNIIGDSEWSINPAGYIIHSAIHGAVPDAHCIMHTHTTSGVAVACKQGGLDGNNFYSAMLHEEVAYHDFEGLTVFEGERRRLVENLGDKQLMILRNHGLLAVGASIPDAFHRLWTLQRACDVQLAADTLAGPTIEVAEEIRIKSTDAARRYDDPEHDTTLRIYDALKRLVHAKDPSYAT